MRFFLPVLVSFLLALAAGCGSSRSSQGEHVPAPVGAEPAVARVSPDSARRFTALLLEAASQRLCGEYAAAYDLTARALALRPDAPTAHYEMGRLLFSLTARADTALRAQGLQHLAQAARLAPRNADYLERLGASLAAAGKYAEAIEAYRRLCAISATPQSLTVLTQLQEETGDFAGAIATLSRLEEIEGRDEGISIEKFKLYNALGDGARAYAAIEQLCAEYPTDLRYRVLLGDLYYQNGSPQMALAVYRDVLTAEPQNSYAQISLLAYYKNAGEDSLYRTAVTDVVLNPATEDEARVEALRGYVMNSLSQHTDTAQVARLFRRVLQLPQESRAVGELFAQYLVEVDAPRESLLPAMESILSAEPDYTRARLQLLDLLLRRGDIERVAQVCDEGQLYTPDDPVFYYYGGIAHLQTGSSEAGLRSLQQGTRYITPATDRDIASDIYAALGDAHHEGGDEPSAYAAYEQALEYNPHNVSCLNNYAYFLSLAGERLDYAERMSRRTIEAEPENATYLDTYAWILYRRGRYAQARRYIDRTLQYCDSTANNSGLYAHAGDIYYRCGQRNAAVRYWIRALSECDEATECAALRRKIKRRRP